MNVELDFELKALLIAELGKHESQILNNIIVGLYALRKESKNPIDSFLWTLNHNFDYFWDRLRMQLRINCTGKILKC